jgi:multiple sugar transport system substrate-binding protein
MPYKEDTGMSDTTRRINPTVVSRRFSRRLALVGLGLPVAAGLLAACGGPTASPTAAPGKPAESKPAAEPTKPAAPAAATKPAATPAAAAPAKAGAAAEISLATDWTEGARGETMKQAVPAFEKQNAKYKLKVEPIGGDYYDKLSVQIAGGTAADVMLFSGAFFLNFQQKGAFADITPLVKALNVDLTRFTSVPKVFEAEGKQYGMPFQLTITTWYANVDMFEKAGVALPKEGWTWDDFLETAKKLTKPEEKQYGMFMTNSAESRWGPLMLSAGGNWFNKDHTKTAFADGEGFEGFKFAVELVTKHKVTPTPAEAKALAAPNTSDLFAAGRTAMTAANSGAVGSLTNLVKDRFRWQPIPQPVSPKNGRMRTTFNDQPHVINARAKDVDGAVALAVFMSGEFVQGLIAAQRGSTPVLRSLQTSEAYLKSPPANMQQIGKNLEKAEDLNFTANWLEWWRAFHAETDKAFIGEATPEDAFKKAIEAGDKVLAKK